ncbi:UNVERIFIED_CONTAM: hypothetical protein FKN15_045068 [Acipenser sinensis]
MKDTTEDQRSKNSTQHVYREMEKLKARLASGADTLKEELKKLWEIKTSDPIVQRKAILELKQVLEKAMRIKKLQKNMQKRRRRRQKKNMYRCVLKKAFEFYTAVLKIYSNPDAIGIIDRMNKSLNCTAENCMDEILACDAAILQFKKLDDAMKQVNNIEIQERAISELDRLSGCLARPKKKCI